MGTPPTSQAAPLPQQLPFRLVSKTIGSGAYASIRKAVPLTAPTPVIAIKFINKEHAFKAGRLRPKQLQLELAIHSAVGGHGRGHDNIIKYLTHGEDKDWVWMALELAEGGDLFDKIEADEGVPEDVAHLYFSQLMGAIEWVHHKGVAHRDIKPENMLLSKTGDLKLADFGLATQYKDLRSGKTKICGMVCGSPPYIAPEILAVGNTNLKRSDGEEKVGYDPMVADIWSCAIVLFVLLVGNTPWDSPVMEESYEYHDYVTSKGRPSDELWNNVPAGAISLVRGMLSIDPATRMSLVDIGHHAWFSRPNPHMDKKGRAANPVQLAQEMLENLQIRFDAPMQLSQREQRRDQSQQSQGDPMDVDTNTSRPEWALRLESTQPMTPIAEAEFGFEPRASQCQDASRPPATTHAAVTNFNSYDLSEDPSMSQYTQSIPFSLTQAARQFNQLLPAEHMNWFPSAMASAQLLPMLLSAMQRCNISINLPDQAGTVLETEGDVSIRIQAFDVNKVPMHGHVIVRKCNRSGLDMLDVEFKRAKADPPGWRRMFKKVAVLCKDAIYFPAGNHR